jgi:hypothetical protein
MRPLLSIFPTLIRIAALQTTPGLCRSKRAMSSDRAAVVFWRAPAYQREPQPPSRVFNRLRRRYVPLTETNPRWCGAQMRQKTDGPPRHSVQCLCSDHDYGTTRVEGP